MRVRPVSCRWTAGDIREEKTAICLALCTKHITVGILTQSLPSPLSTLLNGASSPTKAGQKECYRGLPDEHRCGCLVREYRWVSGLLFNIKLMDTNYNASAETIIS